MILIISDQFDAHADLVMKKIEERGRKAFRFNLDFESLLKTKVTFSDKGFGICVDGTSIASTEVSAAMLRRTFVELSYEMKDELTTSHKIWRGEWNKSLQGIYHFLTSVEIINPPKRAFAAENKFLQMDTARRLGFNVPRTIISNDRASLLGFQQKCGDIVLKMMFQELYREVDGQIRGLYVNKLGSELINFEENGENPVFLQEYIDKAFEVRYTVVGDSHFACKIESQQSVKSSVDWRRYDLPNTPYRRLEPPSEIQEKVRALMNELGLVFGALDFIVSPSGEWYFLEINPMGQWLWVEDLTGLPISDQIVSWLMRGAK